MSLAPEPGIGARLAAEAQGEQTDTKMSGISIDGETFIDFDLDAVMDDEAIALEDAFGVTWLEFLKGLHAGSIKSQKALVWLAQRRDNPALAPDDVSYEVARFQVREEPGPLPVGEPDEPAT